jgi:hypothetical protein
MALNLRGNLTIGSQLVFLWKKSSTLVPHQCSTSAALVVHWLYWPVPRLGGTKDTKVWKAEKKPSCFGAPVECMSENRDQPRRAQSDADPARSFE